MQTPETELRREKEFVYLSQRGEKGRCKASDRSDPADGLSRVRLVRQAGRRIGRAGRESGGQMTGRSGAGVLCRGSQTEQGLEGNSQ